MLGDMHCQKERLNSNIQETHSIKQKDYLLWKYSLLKKYLNLKLSLIKKSLLKDKNKIYIRKPQIRFRSTVSEELNIYHNLFYKNKIKVVNENILDQLDVLGLSIWYCDDGYYDPENRTSQIHTEGFSIKENEIIKNWFKTKWGMNVNFKKDPSKKRVSLRFPVKETDKFLKLISKEIYNLPQSMWYKLGHIWGGNINIINKAKLNKIKRNKEYHKRKETKIRAREHAKKFYYKNQDNILIKRAKYRSTNKYKDYIKNYFQKLAVKDRIREYQKEYRKKPEYKEKFNLYQKEYRKKPEIKDKIKEYNKRRKNGKKA